METPRLRAAGTRGRVGADRSHSSAGEDLVVVSNRQPYRHARAEDGDGIEVDRPTGGLTAGLDGVMRDLEGRWIAWGDGDADRAVVDEDGLVSVPPDLDGDADGDATGRYDLERLWLSEAEVAGYYHGFSNRVLWPVCHSALTEIEGGGDYWEQYRRVNERFAAAARDAAAPDGVVWFQDYHLALAPRAVAGEGDADVVALTWHVPWPAWDVFRCCPHGEAILQGLLGSDLLTVHVDRYRENLLRCVDRAIPEARVDWERGTVAHRGGTTTIRAYPMGVAADRIEEAATGREAERFWREFAAEHDLGDGTAVAVGVDRLDYSKGIVQRLAALEHLLTERPRWRGSITLVQVGTESRSAIPAYRRYQAAVRDAVDRVNDRFGTDDWQPVVYTTEYLADAELYALYRNADLAVVSPIRDGMNLVAQEYVAAQAAGDGVLLLSDQAGAHDELGDWVVSVSPNDVPGFAGALEAALTMPGPQRRHRMAALREYVAANDLSTWIDAVLGEIDRLRALPDANGRPVRT